jgi:hypothetical protein
MIFAANSALTNKSSALGRFRSAKTFPELGVNSRLGTSPVLTFPPTARKLKPLPDQIQFPFRGSRFQIFCLIVCAHLPTDLRLIKCETELVAYRGRKARQPNERVDKPNELARLFRLFGHSLRYMPEMA